VCRASRAGSLHGVLLVIAIVGTTSRVQLFFHSRTFIVQSITPLFIGTSGPTLAGAFVVSGLAARVM